MARVYKTCDILLKTSKLESFCLPALEMMACGGTVVAYETNGVKEYIIDGINGFLVKQGNKEEARKRIEELIEQPDLLKKLRQSSFDTACQFDIKKSKMEFLNVINGILDSKQ